MLTEFFMSRAGLFYIAGVATGNPYDFHRLYLNKFMFRQSQTI